MEVQAGHGWVHDTAVATLTFVSGLGVSDVATALGVSARAPRPATLGDVDPDYEVLIGAESDWTVLLEPYGFAGVTSQVIQQLSARGRLTSLYRSVNEHMTFVYAEGGAERRRFDPLLWPDQQWGDPLAEERGLIFGDPEAVYPYEQAVVLLERITGLRITDEWLFDVARHAYREPSAPGA
jgi:hypothetical protein